MLDRWPVVDISYRLLVAAAGVVIVTTHLLGGHRSVLTVVLVLVTAYNGVTGVLRLRTHRRGDPLRVDAAAWVAARRGLSTDSQPVVVDRWDSDDGWLAVEGLTGSPTHEIWFDDWIAHLHDDAVTEYVTVVRRRARVRDAWREDREVLTVVAPGVTTAVLGRETHTWFLDRIRERHDTGGGSCAPPGRVTD